MDTELSKKDLIGVVGAGTMGTGIARVAATAGHDVLVYDSYADQLGDSKYKLRKRLQQQVEDDQISQQEVNDIMQRIRFTEDMTGFGDCRLIIESVTENLEIKQDLFRRVEGIAPRNCLLTTSTSSLSITAIASVLKRPNRFLGIHFFNPAPMIPLVEIIPGLATDHKHVNTAEHLIKQWGKTTVQAKDTPGFIVNRVIRPFFGEALRQLEEGVADVPTIDWAVKEIGGFPMGPFELMDTIGNDINYNVTETIFEKLFYDPRFKPSITQKRMVQAGYLGKKSGKGFYEYGKNAENPVPQKDKNAGEQIVNRILAMLINEAADAVFWDIASVEEVDVAVTKAAQFPRGLLQWADEIGLPNVLDQISALQVRYRDDRYRPSPILKRKVKNEETFY